MLALATAAELTAYTEAPVAEAERIANAVSDAAAALEVETGRHLAWRTYRRDAAIDDALIDANLRLVTHAGEVTVGVGDVVSARSIPWGTQVASVIDDTSFLLDSDAEAGSADLVIGQGLLRCRADGGTTLLASEVPLDSITSVVMNDIEIPCTPVIISGETGLFDVGVDVARWSLVYASGSAGVTAASAEARLARLATLRIGSILWQREVTRAGASLGESIGQRSMQRQFAWPDDVRDMIKQLRRLA